MKLAYYQSEPTNFGDELNAYMWHRLLPEGFLDDDASELFVGIGSILGEIFPEDSVKHVMGSGAGGYARLPDLANGRWNVVFVRGHHSAEALGLSPETAICDSAVLLREVQDLPEPAVGIGTAFMPHFQSLPRGDWARVCRLAGVTLIDPTDPPETVLAQIQGAKLLITEAMHGAIVADALRTPWVAARPFHNTHRGKWSDWAGTLGLTPRWVRLWPSAPRELVSFLTGKAPARLADQRWPESAWLAPVATLLAQAAAMRLRRISRNGQGQLSGDEAIRGATRRARAALDGFVASRARAETPIERAS